MVSILFCLDGFRLSWSLSSMSWLCLSASALVVHFCLVLYLFSVLIVLILFCLYILLLSILLSPLFTFLSCFIFILCLDCLDLVLSLYSSSKYIAITSVLMVFFCLRFSPSQNFSCRNHLCFCLGFFLWIFLDSLDLGLSQLSLSCFTFILCLDCLEVGGLRLSWLLSSLSWLCTSASALA